MGDCKKELIKFYNKELSEETDEKSDNDWYDTLNVYSVYIGIGINGKFFAEISVGNGFVSVHILDIEIEEQKNKNELCRINELPLTLGFGANLPDAQLRNFRTSSLSLIFFHKYYSLFYELENNLYLCKPILR